jgi:hypothetical protein
MGSRSHQSPVSLTLLRITVQSFIGRTPEGARSQMALVRMRLETWRIQPVPWCGYVCTPWAGCAWAPDMRLIVGMTPRVSVPISSP